MNTYAGKAAKEDSVRIQDLVKIQSGQQQLEQKLGKGTELVITD